MRKRLARYATLLIAALVLTAPGPVSAQAGCANPVSPLAAFGVAGGDLLATAQQLGAYGISVRIRHLGQSPDSDLADWLVQSARTCGWSGDLEVLAPDLLIIAVADSGQAGIWTGSDVLLNDPAIVDDLTAGLRDAIVSGQLGAGVLSALGSFLSAQDLVIDSPETCDAVVLPQQPFGAVAATVADRTEGLRRLGVDVRLRLLTDIDYAQPRTWFRQTTTTTCPQWTAAGDIAADRLVVVVFTPDALLVDEAVESWAGAHAPSLYGDLTELRPQIVAHVKAGELPQAATLLLDGLTSASGRALDADTVGAPGDVGQQPCNLSAMDPWDGMDPAQRQRLEVLATNGAAAGINLQPRLLPGTTAGLADWIARQEVGCESWAFDGARHPDLLVPAVSTGGHESGLFYGDNLRDALDPIAADLQAEMTALVDAGRPADALEEVTRRALVEIGIDATNSPDALTPRADVLPDRPSSAVPERDSAAGAADNGNLALGLGSLLLLLAGFAVVRGRRSGRWTAPTSDAGFVRTQAIWGVAQVEHEWHALEQQMGQRRQTLAADDALGLSLDQTHQTIADATKAATSAVVEAHDTDGVTRRSPPEEVRRSHQAWRDAHSAVLVASTALKSGHHALASLEIDETLAVSMSGSVTRKLTAAQRSLDRLAEIGHTVCDLQTRLTQANAVIAATPGDLESGHLAAVLDTLRRVSDEIDDVAQQAEDLPFRAARLRRECADAHDSIDQVQRPLSEAIDRWAELIATHGPESVGTGVGPIHDDDPSGPLPVPGPTRLARVRAAVAEPLPAAPGNGDLKRAQLALDDARTLLHQAQAFMRREAMTRDAIEVATQHWQQHRLHVAAELDSLDLFTATGDQVLSDRQQADITATRNLLAETDSLMAAGRPDPVRAARLLRQAAAEVQRLQQAVLAAHAGRDARAFGPADHPA